MIAGREGCQRKRTGWHGVKKGKAALLPALPSALLPALLLQERPGWRRGREGGRGGREGVKRERR
jgi:hypothetical protein